jgi:tetratricopeptide (TPR) repeat protein
MGEYAKVIDLLAPREKTSPDDLGIAYLLGTALVRANRVEEGQRVLNRIFEKGDSAEARLLLGAAKMNQADFAGAVQDFAKAVELNGKLPTVKSSYGQALMATGDSAGAAAAFRQELALNPNQFDANLNLAVILKQDQEYKESLRLLERALRIRPGDLSARYQVATIHLAQGKIEEARQELESCTADAPSFTEAHVSLATVYYRLKRKEDGDRQRAIVLKLNEEAQAKQPKGEVIRNP